VNIMAPEKQMLAEAIGTFILDLGMIENCMVQALAVLVNVPQGQAHFLLNKTAGGAKAALLKDAVTAKGIDLKVTGLGVAIGTIQEIMNFRNRLVHDAIGFHKNSQRWVLGQGLSEGDAVFGKRLPLGADDLRSKSRDAWTAIEVIGTEILVKHGGWTWSTATASTATDPT
jgi:hypothetical protein